MVRTHYAQKFESIFFAYIIITIQFQGIGPRSMESMHSKTRGTVYIKQNCK